MEAVFLIILLAVLVGVVWWRLNAKKSPAARDSAGQAAAARGDGATRTDGALSGGSAAASAEAAGTTGIPTAAGFGRPAEPAAPVTADEPAETSAPVDAPRHERTGSGSSAASPAATAGTGAAGAGAAGAGAATAGPATGSPATEGVGDDRRRQDQAEWETQWSEASGASPARTAPTPPVQPVAQKTGTQQDAVAEAAPIHHAEYTEPHAPTLPGAESAAVEEGDDDGTAARTVGRSADRPEAVGVSGGTIPAAAAAAETLDRAQSSALVETGADHLTEQEAGTRGHSPEAAGHLAADEPYGAGSAAARADGSGPADYGVKADAGAMVYYEEGHPDYEQAKADVWFESAAHAEAAGFRAPRRRRL